MSDSESESIHASDASEASDASDLDGFIVDSDSESSDESVDGDAEIVQQYARVSGHGSVVNEQGLRRSTRARRPVERFTDVHGAAMFALYADDEDDPATRAALQELQRESEHVERLREQVARTRSRIYDLYDRGRDGETAELERRLAGLQEQERQATSALVQRRRAMETAASDSDASSESDDDPPVTKRRRGRVVSDSESES